VERSDLPGSSKVEEGQNFILDEANSKMESLEQVPIDDEKGIN
jgi:hypothetical protein